MKLRAHHLMCLQTFEDEGYDENMIRRMAEIINTIRNQPKTRIEILRRCDDICEACPYIKNGRCNKRLNLEKFVRLLDSDVLKRTGLKEGQTMKAKEVFPLVKQKIKPEDLATICKGCEWLEKGCIDCYRRGELP